MDRMYSTLTVKEVDDGQRIIQGVATTPATDRMGDIVEPNGLQFKLPFPLLWQHNSREPIGWVENAKVTDKGMTVTARVAEAGLSPEIDRAWKLIKSGLVRGLSIGFKALETADIKDSWGIRFIKAEILELSAVTIPANQEASITSVKNFDIASRAASGHETKSVVVRLASAPAGVPAKSVSTQPTEGTPSMKTIQEIIAGYEATRQAKAARKSEILSKANEEGRTLDENESAEFETLKQELKAIDEHIARLTDELETSKATATPVRADAGTDPAATVTAPVHNPATQARGTTPIISVRPNVEKGIAFARYAMALKRAHGNLSDALAIVVNNKSWMDSTPQLANVMKNAVAAGDTTTSGWASELVYAQNLANEFIEYLRPKTILGRVDGWRRVPFNVRMGSQTAGSTGYWVGQGAPIPVSKLTTGSTSLDITKAAGIVVLDEELVRSSSPSAEMLVRDDLRDALVYLLDRSLIDPTQGGTDDVQPASLTYGITPVTPTGVTYATLAADFRNLTDDMIADNIDMSACVWVMSQTTAQALSLMVTSLGVPQFPQMTPLGGTLFGFPVIVSQSAYFSSGSPDYGNMMVFINPREVFLADDGQITIEISREASLQMLDNPTNASTSGTTATTMVSMFQTQSEAIKAVRYINWKKRRTNAVAFIRNAAYTG